MTLMTFADLLRCLSSLSRVTPAAMEMTRCDFFTSGLISSSTLSMTWGFTAKRTIWASFIPSLLLENVEMVYSFSRYFRLSSMGSEQTMSFGENTSFLISPFIRASAIWPPPTKQIVPSSIFSLIYQGSPFLAKWGRRVSSGQYPFQWQFLSPSHSG